jgi:hypothetical protein
MDVDRRVDQLLSAPRALWLLASLATVDPGNPPMGWTGSRPPDYFETAVPGPLVDAEWKLLDRALTLLRDWQWRDMAPIVEMLRARAPELRPIVTDLLVEATSAWWWWEPLRRGNQTWVALASDPSPSSGYVPDLRDYPGEATKPAKATWTSTWVGGIPSSWLYEAWEGDAELPLQMWWLRVDPKARVYEIHKPNDWITLCERYPKDTTPQFGKLRSWGGMAGGTFLTPNWVDVAADWDGIHLSVAGLLTSSGVPMEVPGLGRTYLEGWHTESTAWFRWAFTEARRLPDWTDPIPMGVDLGGLPNKARALRLAKLRIDQGEGNENCQARTASS